MNETDIQREEPSATQRRARFTACFLTFAFNGALALSIGALLPYVRQTYGLSYAFAGLLVSLHSIGNLISSFAGGALALRLGRRRSILIFISCYAAGFLVMILSGRPVVLVAAFLLTGLARGATSNFNNAEVNLLASGAGWALNALHASFAVGAFTAPLLVLLCAQVLGRWQLMGVLLAVFGLISFIIYAMMPLPDSLTQAKGADGGWGFLREGVFWTTTLTLFFYLCAEQGMIGWMVTYFQDSRLMPAAYAQTLASVLWILILVGRLTAAWLCARVSPSTLLIGMSGGMAAFFAVTILGRTLPVITIGIAGFGFFMAGLYPTRVSMTSGLMKRYPLAWSVILTAASLGSILMPSVIGAVAEAAGLYAGISTVLIAVAATLVMTVVSRFAES